MSTRAQEGVLDIETTNWIDALCVCARLVDRPDVRWEWRGPASLKACAEFLRRNGGTWWAHFGGGFDFILLMPFLGMPDEVILAGGKILKARWFKTDATPTLTLRDSYPLMNVPLKKLGTWVGQEKGELDRETLADQPIALVCEYCQNDCDVLAMALLKMREWARARGAAPKNTSGAQAVELLRAMEPMAWGAMIECALDTDLALRAQKEKWVRGGRTEICWCGPVDDVWCYDANSMYPAQYSKAKLPIGCALDGVPTRAALYHAVWQRMSREAPAFVVGSGGIGAGYCEAWLTCEELDAMHVYEGRNLKVLKITDRIWASDWINVGAEFARDLYAARRAGDVAAKLILNSLHGKFGERIERMNYVKETGVDGDPVLMPRKVMTKGRRPGLAPIHVQPLAGAFVLGRARIALLQRAFALKSAGHAVYYMDTDSIFTDANPAQFSAAGGQIGERLGEWKIERGPLPATFVAAKLYKHGTVKHAKGVPPDTLDDGAFNRMATGLIASVPRKGIATWLETVWQGKKPRARTEKETRKLTRVLPYKEREPSGQLRYTEEWLLPLGLYATGP